MERKTWVMPMTLVQKFEANEAVSACWGVACDTETANRWQGSYLPWWQPVSATKHSASECGDFTHQVLRDTNDDGTVDEMIETRDGGLYCTLYSDDSYKQTISPSVVSPETTEMIFWTTTKEVSPGIHYTWHHRGTVEASDPKHPNRS